MLGLLGSRSLSGESRRAWQIFFAGVTLVSVGSAYYHLDPTNATLFWDRAPMALAFMALVIAVLTEHEETSRAQRALLPAIALGLASVLWWRYANDLRLYGWVQFASLAIVALVVWLCTPRYTHRAYLAYGLLFYGAAKLAELGDISFYRWSGETLSGHSLKHLLAALAPLAIYLMIVRRRAATTAN